MSAENPMPEDLEAQDLDLDEMLRGLHAPAPPVRAPRPRPVWRVGVLALAAVLLLSLGIGLSREDSGLLLRGAPPIAAPSLDLRMAVERGGSALRVSEGGTYRVGERVFFRVSAQLPTDALLFVEGPSGRERITRLQAGPQAEDVSSDHGLMAYTFDQPGHYVFGLSPLDAPARGPRIHLEVR